MVPNEKTNAAVSIGIEVFIRLILLLIIIAWCFQIVLPFSGVILWGIILALALAPLYNWINKKVQGKSKLAATIIILAGLLIIILPSWLFMESTIDGMKEFSSQLDEGTLTVPPPPEKVADWPLVGEKAYALWKQASADLEVFVGKYHDQIVDITKSFIEKLLGIGGSILQIAFAIIVAGILLATKGTEDASKRFFTRLIGAGGEKISDLVTRTVANVTKGVLGVAIIQALLVGLGFVLAGVPYAGLWTLVVMFLAILQLPPLLVVLPVVIYLFSTMGTGGAILWTIYLILAGASDNVLKPILLGKGAPVPMLVIFLGVVGGFMLSGFIGLFTGAIVLSLGYKLFIAWMSEGKEEAASTSDTK